MAIRPTLGRNNRLVRRVMRHRSVTTLFPTAPPGAAWPAGSASRAARSDQGPTADAGYVAVVIEPAAYAVPTTVVAAAPEVRVSRRSAATPTRVPLGEPARVVRSSDPAPVGNVPQPQSPAAARMTSVTAPAPVAQAIPSVTAAPVSPRPDQAEQTVTPETRTREPSTPAVDNGGETTITDQVWRRLQTIFRRHQAPTSTKPEAAALTDAVAEPEAVVEAETPPLEAEPAGDTPSASVDTAPAAATATGTPGGPVQRMPDAAVAAPAARVTDSIAGTAAQATVLPSAETARSSAARQDQRPGVIEMAHTSEPLVTDTALGSPAEVDEDVGITPAVTEALPLATLDRSTEPSALSAQQRIVAAGLARPAGTTLPAATEVSAPLVASEPAEIAATGLTEPGGPAVPLSLFEAGSPLPSAPVGRAAAPAQPAPLEQVERPGQPTPVPPFAQPATEIRVPAPDRTVSAIAASSAVTPQAAPPLQDVWAVQRLPEPVRTVSGPVAIPAADRDRQLLQTTPEPMPDEIAEILDRVAAGRPTQSTIEVILPRRPRPPQRPSPVRAQQPAATLVAESVAPPEAALLEQETAQPTIPPTSATTALQKPPAQRLLASEPASPEAIVVPFEGASGEDGPRPLPTVTPPVVETEIGALPADLWELIGETPPAPQGMPHSLPLEPHAPTTEPAPVPVARMQSSGPGPMLQRSAISTTAQAPASATATQQGGPVQTSTQQAPASSAAASEPAVSETGTAAAAETEASGEPAVDVDKLAHRVYADIKRRLTVEWERIRRF